MQPQYNRATPRNASFVRLALYHVPQWRAPLKRNYGKAVSYAAKAKALGHGKAGVQGYLALCYAAHKHGLPLPAAQPLRLTGPS